MPLHSVVTASSGHGPGLDIGVIRAKGEEGRNGETTQREDQSYAGHPRPDQVEQGQEGGRHEGSAVDH